MIIGNDIIASRAIPLLEAFPCDALYLLIDKAVDKVQRKYLTPLYQLTREECIHLSDGGEECKGIVGLTSLWQWLARTRASRQSVLVVVGGGSLSDLAGFASATYMRGIRVVYVPTTLLAMVDASIGGKTAIDFAGIKNLVGTFHQPEEIIVDTNFLDSLPIEELYSGYAEVIKTALLAGEDLWRRVQQLEPQSIDTIEWIDLISICANYKQSIVEQDPKEQTGLRKGLNFGHTVGHALEAFSIDRGGRLFHGEAVAIGLIVESYMSVRLLGLDIQVLRGLHALVKSLYRGYAYTCRNYPRLIDLMRSDKKASGGNLSFTLLDSIGSYRTIALEDTTLLEEALDFYRET